MITKARTAIQSVELERLKYFYGQMLDHHDFELEQRYFRDKAKLHNRCLHGYGTVCGLRIAPARPPDDCESPEDARRRRLEQERRTLSDKIAALREAQDEADPEDDVEALNRELDSLTARLEDVRRQLERLPTSVGPGHPTTVIVEPGLALDCHGNELVVRHPLEVDLWATLSAADRRRVEGGEPSLYVSLCYDEQSTHPVRPVLPEACGASPECTHGRVRDCVAVRVSVDRPCDDPGCDPCCEPCDDPCLTVARIDHFRRGEPVEAEEIHNEVRRSITRHAYAKISGVSWTHGAEYTAEEAVKLLGTDWGREPRTDGIEVCFSRPVRAETLRRGVVDLWRVQGGRGLSGVISEIRGEFVGTPSSGLVRSFRYRDVTGETLQPHDRVLITVRSAFILDECCQPVDGLHVGGRVPILPEYEQFANKTPTEPCDAPPGRFAPWRSGVGTPGGNFESWFYIKPNRGEARI